MLHSWWGHCGFTLAPWLISAAKKKWRVSGTRENMLQDIQHTDTLDNTAQQSFGLHPFSWQIERSFTNSVEIKHSVTLCNQLDKNALHDNIYESFNVFKHRVKSHHLHSPHTTVSAAAVLHSSQIYRFGDQRWKGKRSRRRLERETIKGWERWRIFFWCRSIKDIWLPVEQEKSRSVRGRIICMWESEGENGVIPFWKMRRRKYEEREMWLEMRKRNVGEAGVRENKDTFITSRPEHCLPMLNPFCLQAKLLFLNS